MLDIVLSNQFKKDLKIAQKRGYNLELLNSVVDVLANCEPLAEKIQRPQSYGQICGVSRMSYPTRLDFGLQS